MVDGEHSPGAGIGQEHLAALSHELRTPLSGVLGMAQLLEGTRLTGEQRAYVEALKESGEHLLGLVNDVLDFARLGAAHVTHDPTEIDLEELLRSVCELMSPRAHAKGIEIGWAAQSGLPRVFADEGRLKQILLNFAGNAVKFVDKGGVLLVAERRAAGAFRLCAIDTGPGVPPDAAERVFEPFARLERPCGADAGGAGLGLAIARRIAEAAGGRVGVETAAGGGANFWFEARPKRRDRPPQEAPLSDQVVAIASPSSIVREAAALQIEASGGRAVHASSLSEALERTEAGVVLADHAESGKGLLRLPKDRPVVILLRPEERCLITGYRREGGAGYLIKPLRRSSLVLMVLAARAGLSIPEDERVVETPDEGARLGLAGARVLLAEDNPINAMLARTLLRREGCEVEHVTDGAAAVLAAVANPYDLVLMDVRMPGMGGIEATRRLREAGVGTPVVALTADAFEDDRLACLAAGMDDFLVKPLSLDALRPALDRWLKAGWTPAATRAKLKGLSAA
jgi:CheY-like chemotaxis protein